MAYSIVDSALPWSATSGAVIGYGGGRFLVARTFSTSVALSTDSGATWSLRTRPSSGEAVQFAYGNGVFVLVTGSSTVNVTADGISWVTATMPATGYWTSVAFGNGRFVAISSPGKSAWSTDGQTWTLGTPIFTPTSGWTYVGFNGAVFITDDTTDGDQNEYVYKSADGATWTRELVPLQLYADTYNSSGNGARMFTSSTGVVTATGATPAWEYTPHAVGAALSYPYSVTVFFDGKYINCDRSGTNRFRISSDIANATYEATATTYNVSNLYSDAAVGAEAALFLVQGASSIRRVFGIYKSAAPPARTEFWQNLTGTEEL